MCYVFIKIYSRGNKKENKLSRYYCTMSLRNNMEQDQILNDALFNAEQNNEYKFNL